MAARSQRFTDRLRQLRGLRRSLTAAICTGAAVTAGFGDTPKPPQLVAAAASCLLTAFLAWDELAQPSKKMALIRHLASYRRTY